MVTEGEELVREQCMLCRDGRHAVGLRVNTLRTCTEQQTVQVLTHIYRYTHFRHVTRYYPLQVYLWDIPPQAQINR